MFSLFCECCFFWFFKREYIQILFSAFSFSSLNYTAYTSRQKKNDSRKNKMKNNKKNNYCQYITLSIYFFYLSIYMNFCFFAFINFFDSFFLHSFVFVNSLSVRKTPSSFAFSSFSFCNSSFSSKIPCLGFTFSKIEKINQVLSKAEEKEKRRRGRNLSEDENGHFFLSTKTENKNSFLKKDTKEEETKKKKTNFQNYLYDEAEKNDEYANNGYNTNNNITNNIYCNSYNNNVTNICRKEKNKMEVRGNDYLQTKENINMLIKANNANNFVKNDSKKTISLNKKEKVLHIRRLQQNENKVSDMEGKNVYISKNNNNFVNINKNEKPLNNKELEAMQNNNTSSTKNEIKENNIKIIEFAEIDEYKKQFVYAHPNDTLFIKFHSDAAIPHTWTIDKSIVTEWLELECEGFVPKLKPSSSAYDKPNSLKGFYVFLFHVRNYGRSILQFEFRFPSNSVEKLNFLEVVSEFDNTKKYEVKKNEKNNQKENVKSKKNTKEENEIFAENKEETKENECQKMNKNDDEKSSMIINKHQNYFLKLCKIENEERKNEILKIYEQEEHLGRCKKINDM